MRYWLVPVAAVLALAAGCARETVVDTEVVEPKTVVLEAGTEVQLLLATRLTSGGSSVGDPALFLVAEDIESEDGAVLIPAGTPVRAEVSRSRGSTAATTLINQPARLEVEIGGVEAFDGQAVALSRGSKGAYEFTLENTDLDDLPADGLQELWDAPESRQFLERLAQDVESGKVSDSLDDSEALARMAKQLGLDSTDAFVSKSMSEPEEVAAIAAAIEAMESGEVAGGLDSIEALLLVRALGELGGVLQTVDRRIRGIFKGRNIRAEVGTPVTVHIAEPVTFLIAALSGRLREGYRLRQESKKIARGRSGDPGDAETAIFDPEGVAETSRTVGANMRIWHPFRVRIL